MSDKLELKPELKPESEVPKPVTPSVQPVTLIPTPPVINSELRLVRKVAETELAIANTATLDVTGKAKVYIVPAKWFATSDTKKVTSLEGIFEVQYFEALGEFTFTAYDLLEAIVRNDLHEDSVSNKDHVNRAVSLTNRFSVSHRRLLSAIHKANK